MNRRLELQHRRARRYRAEFRGVLLALAGIDRYDLVGQAGFLQKQGDLRGVWGRVVVEADHVEPFLTQQKATRFPAKSGTADLTALPLAAHFRASELKCTKLTVPAMAFVHYEAPARESSAREKNRAALGCLAVLAQPL